MTDKGRYFNNELITYYVDVGAVVQSTTGQVVHRERGPFCVNVKGSCHKPPMTDEEVVEYVKKQHGVGPLRIVRELMSL